MHAEERRTTIDLRDGAASQGARATFGHSEHTSCKTLSAARSRLNQRRFLRLNTHFSAYFKIYKNSFAPFQIFQIFRNFWMFFSKIQHHSANFHGRKQICQIFSKFSRIFFGISQNFCDFDDSDVAIPIFRRFPRKMQKFCGAKGRQAAR